MMDILSGDLTYYNKETKLRAKAFNLIREMRSDVQFFGEKNKELKYRKGDVEDHMYAWAKTFKPRLCINVPKWDGEDRVQLLANLITLSPKYTSQSGITHQYFSEFLKDWISKKWIKLYHPQDMDAQNRLFLIVGKQEIGKDEWINHVIRGFGQYAPPLTISSGHGNDADMKTPLHTGVVLNISEFDRTAVMSTASLKAIITESATNVRKPFGHSEEYKYVRSSLISSCNKHPTELLKDWTGNRRFLPFVIESIKWIKTSHDFHLQVLAQGIELGRNKVFASKEAEELMSKYQTILTPESPEDECCTALDELMEVEIERLKIEGKSDRIDDWYSAGNDEFKGYCPNIHLNEMGIIKDIISRTKYQSRKVLFSLRHERGHKNKSGVVIGKSVCRVVSRGFYFHPIVEYGQPDELLPDDDFDMFQL